MTENFNKVIRIGTVTEGPASASVFCSIKFTDGKLSITGVVGPRASGNCAGSCGQIECSTQTSAVLGCVASLPSDVALMLGDG